VSKRGYQHSTRAILSIINKMDSFDENLDWTEDMSIIKTWYGRMAFPEAGLAAELPDVDRQPAGGERAASSDWMDEDPVDGGDDEVRADDDVGLEKGPAKFQPHGAPPLGFNQQRPVLQPTGFQHLV
jgi:hypothetical protein